MQQQAAARHTATCERGFEIRCEKKTTSQQQATQGRQYFDEWEGVTQISSRTGSSLIAFNGSTDISLWKACIRAHALRCARGMHKKHAQDGLLNIVCSMPGGGACVIYVRKIACLCMWYNLLGSEIIPTISQDITVFIAPVIGSRYENMVRAWLTCRK